MKLTRLVSLLLILIATICLLLWFEFDGKASEFGLNAFTETLGILVTVLIVNQLIKRQEELRLLPQQAAAYEDVRLLTSRMVSFWTEAYRVSVPGEPPGNLEELFNKKSFEKIRKHLSLDSRPNVTPKRTWWEWFPHNQLEFKNMSETILERHNSILDPEAYSAVHKIATNSMDPNLMTTLRQSDATSGFPRPKVLGSYWFLLDDYIEPILTLVSWCEQKMVRLESSDIKGLKKVATEVHQWEPQTNPQCMISAAELQKQIKDVQAFRENNKTIDV